MKITPSSGPRALRAAVLHRHGATSKPAVDHRLGVNAGVRSGRVVAGQRAGPHAAGDGATIRTATDATRILLNLAAPGTLSAVVSLRAAGIAKRVWAYLGAPGTRCALLLGPVDVAARPCDAAVLASRVATLTPRTARVVMASGDGDMALAFRHALVQAGRSVSLAWDAKQARDVLALVRPDLVVIDLDLAGGGHRLVASLVQHRVAPAMVLLPSERGDDAAGHLAAFATPEHTPYLHLRQELLAMALSRYEGASAPAVRIAGSLGQLALPTTASAARRSTPGSNRPLHPGRSGGGRIPSPCRATDAVSGEANCS